MFYVNLQEAAQGMENEKQAEKDPCFIQGRITLCYSHTHIFTLPYYKVITSPDLTYRGDHQEYELSSSLNP